MDALLSNLPNPLWEYARTGNLYHGGVNLKANGIASVQEFPTTTADAALYNNNNVASNRCIIVHHVSFFYASGTETAGASLLCCVTPQEVADGSKPTANATGFNTTNCRGGLGNDSNCFWTTALTVPCAAANWVHVGSNFQLTSTLLGQGIQPFECLFVVPPRCALGIVVLSGAGTSPVYPVSAQFSILPLELDNKR